MHVMTRVDRVPHSRSQYMVVLAVVRYGCIRSAGTAHGESWASGPAGPLCRVEPACGGRLLARRRVGRPRRGVDVYSGASTRARQRQGHQNLAAAAAAPTVLLYEACRGYQMLTVLLLHKGLHQLSPALTQIFFVHEFMMTQ
jgi:hypothetical protein